jgi:hypothetical protein
MIRCPIEHNVSETGTVRRETPTLLGPVERAVGRYGLSCRLKPPSTALCPLLCPPSVGKHSGTDPRGPSTSAGDSSCTGSVRWAGPCGANVIRRKQTPHDSSNLGLSRQGKKINTSRVILWPSGFQTSCPFWVSNIVSSYKSNLLDTNVSEVYNVSIFRVPTFRRNTLPPFSGCQRFGRTYSLHL